MLKILASSLLSCIMLQQSCNSNSDTKINPAATHSDSTGFAIVELFTSEGCSSCPPADKLATVLAEDAAKNGQVVLVLSEHVDYWDRIGWKDPFSSHFFTERQGWYAGFFKEESVYTPQMVVNGVTGFVGSDKGKATTGIAAALKATHSSKKILLSATGPNPDNFTYTVPNVGKNEVLHLVLVQKSAVSKVLRGENAGRTLTHNNVVLDWKTLESPATSGSVKFKNGLVIQPGEYNVIAFVQDKGSGAISSAGFLQR
ncbi:MAG: DUF1223 domain-containing protein [Chitinophagaceae bacterium]